MLSEKNRKHLVSVRKYTLRTLLILGITILFLLVTVFFSLLLIMRGPSPSLRALLVRSLKETSAAGFVADIYLSQSEIDEILHADGADQGIAVDTGMINLPHKDEETEPQESKGTSDTGVPDTAPETEAPEPGDGIELFDIVSSTYRGKLMVVKDPTRVFVASLPEFHDDRPGWMLPVFLEKFNAVAAVNAGGFVDGGGNGFGGMPVGIVISDGRIVYGSPDETYSLCGFDKNGLLYVGKMTGSEALERGITSACSFGPALIINGVPVSGQGSGLNPRTAIGQRADGAILLLTLAGRQIDCIGATFEDVTEILYSYGAVNATNLDGGSSTMMYYNGERQIKSSSLVGERPLPTAILVR